MTLQELAKLDRETITPAEAAEVLGTNPYMLNILAKRHQLPFPHMMAGDHLKIFRRPFLKAMGYEVPEQ